ncbi:sushi, von Willebrand factor type A, EGF and pentraxin domain-containing protein 1-like [Corticium candelabrum]|uniref:sushi, von Willebrand factor type A, EGF and pentraxin domain-containing protein 1-like n=1 Tax=Corticium candelabrum TaxID=121492 RepID=UPI002E26496E|nr:sushi, von Willebrand factor type A, EGF and pentraxin domain-containing protein 1-like [Corticium candelabrum]
MSIKLYLRNGSDRQRQQNGMKVTVEDRNGQKHQCGETYNQLTQGQYPTFECRNGILSCFIRLTLDHTKKTPVRNKPIQVCELEVFVVSECGNPPPIRFAARDFQSVTIKSQATYTCMPTYLPTSSQTITCLSHGNWSLSLSPCVPSCNVPQERVKNASTKLPNKTRQPVGSTVNYTCDSGYMKKGQNKLTCNSSAEWEGEIICQEFFCDHMPVLQQGRVEGNSNKVRFSCFYGYRLKNAGSAYCGENNTWIYLNKQPPACQVMKCQELELENGIVPKHNLTVNSTIKFACKKGYERKGINSRKCVSNNKTAFWDPSDPVSCQVKRCQKPAKPTNGSITGQEYTYSKIIHFQCDNGHDIKGIANFSCNENGEWVDADSKSSIVFPTCHPKNCGKPRVLQNAKFTEKSYVFPNKITYKCKKGYCAKGNLTTRCLANGKWSAEDRSCKRVKCSMLTSPMNGSVRPDTNQEITVGFQANFACNPGYILIGNSTIYCQQKENPFDCQGKWSENEPICKPRRCGKPIIADPQIRKIVGDKFYFPEVIQFQCVNGYNLRKGGARWHCSHDGIWIDTENSKSRKYPICKPVKCEKLTNPENGKMEGQNFEFLAEVKFSCNRGYCIKGSLGSNCQASGKWSSEPPRCNRVKCNKPSKPKFGQISVNTTDIFVDFIATYQCNNGYDINGNSSLHKYERICMQNETINHCVGKWSNTQPVCKPKRCPTVMKQNKRTILGEVYEYSHSITIVCDDGHELRGGSSVWNCSEQGTWIDTMTEKSGELPSCERFFCDHMPVLKNGRVQGNTNKVIFSCFYGYRLKNAGSAYCWEKNTWRYLNNQPPTCQVMKCQEIELENGIVPKHNLTVNSTITFACKNGYKRKGINLRKCVSNTTTAFWDPSDPVSCKGSLEMDKLDSFTFLIIT